MLCCLAIPNSSLCVVLLQAATILVKQCEVVLCACVALVTRFLIPNSGLRVVLHYALAVGVMCAEIELCVGIAGVCLGQQSRVDALGRNLGLERGGEQGKDDGKDHRGCKDKYVPELLPVFVHGNSHNHQDDSTWPCLPLLRLLPVAVLRFFTTQIGKSFSSHSLPISAEIGRNTLYIARASSHQESGRRFRLGVSRRLERS